MPCPSWAAGAECEEGHGVSKLLYCGREWCDDCGLDGSDTHMRRLSRWIPKAQQLRSMGYLVITFPLEVRQRLRTRAAWSSIATRLVRLLQRMGVTRGLRRWHWFGDESKGVWNPHLNFLMDLGHVTPEWLDGLKERVARIVGAPCVLHYQYTRIPAKMMHMLRYVLRPTFRDAAWDLPMAYEVKGYRNCWQWGRWKDDAVWKVESAEVKWKEAQRLQANRCPCCDKPLKWKSIMPASQLKTLGAVPLGGGYFLLPGRNERRGKGPDHGADG